MCKLVLNRGDFSDFTSVSNVFIDEYMPKANGEFIKIYLHLLRLVNGHNNHASQELSTERIADKFNVLESDVIRALNYWSTQGLLSLSSNNKGELTGVKLESTVSNHYFIKSITDKETEVLEKSQEHLLAKASGEYISSPIPEPEGIIIPSKTKYSAKEIEAFSGDERLMQLTFLVETYLGKTLSPSDINSILYMLDGLNFKTDFIEYIIERCMDNGIKSLASIERHAVTYAHKGIYTVEDAKTDEKLRECISQSIYKIFGLSPKAPVKKDISFISKWTSQYGFSDEIIIEACNRTMARTHTGSFEYADGILTNWFNHNAQSMDAIEQLDAAHSKEVTNSFKTIHTNIKNSRPKNSRAFKERDYNYEDLEKKLRSSQNNKIKKLLSNKNSEN